MSNFGGLSVPVKEIMRRKKFNKIVVLLYLCRKIFYKGILKLFF